MLRAFACLLAFASLAAHPLDGAVIVVDAGHGGQSHSKSYTGGTKGVASKLTESDLNLRVAFELENRRVALAIASALHSNQTGTSSPSDGGEVQGTGNSQCHAAETEAQALADAAALYWKQYQKDLAELRTKLSQA